MCKIVLNSTTIEGKHGTHWTAQSYHGEKIAPSYGDVRSRDSGGKYDKDSIRSERKLHHSRGIHV